MSCPPPMPCEEIIAKLWEFIDRELAPGPAERIRAHLTLCDDCRTQYEFQTAFIGMLGRQRDGKAPPELRRRIVEHILREQADEAATE